jgi:hypothetical protein
MVRRKFICHYFLYFKAVFKGPWVESVAQSLTLHNTALRTFTVLIGLSVSIDSAFASPCLFFCPDLRIFAVKHTNFAFAGFTPIGG